MGMWQWNKIRRGRDFYPGWLKKTEILFTGCKSIHGRNIQVVSPASQSEFLKKQNELLKNGTRVNAMVLRVEDTGMKINVNPVVLLSLRIEAFTSMVVQITSEVLLTNHKPLAGDRILIAFNPDDTGIVAIV